MWCSLEVFTVNLIISAKFLKNDRFLKNSTMCTHCLTLTNARRRSLLLLNVPPLTINLTVIVKCKKRFRKKDLSLDRPQYPDEIPTEERVRLKLGRVSTLVHQQKVHHKCRSPGRNKSSGWIRQVQSVSKSRLYHHQSLASHQAADIRVQLDRDRNPIINLDTLPSVYKSSKWLYFEGEKNLFSHILIQKKKSTIEHSW